MWLRNKTNTYEKSLRNNVRAMGKGYEETADKEVWVPGNTYPPAGLSSDGEGEQIE